MLAGLSPLMEEAQPRASFAGVLSGMSDIKGKDSNPLLQAIKQKKHTPRLSCRLEEQEEFDKEPEPKAKGKRRVRMSDGSDLDSRSSIGTATCTIASDVGTDMMPN